MPDNPADPPETAVHQPNSAMGKQPSWKITLRLLVDECAESENPYLRQFAASPLARIFLTNDTVGNSVGRRGRSDLRKELTEAAALEAQLVRKLKQWVSPNGGARGGRRLVLWDLCSGKGISAMWLSANTFANHDDGDRVHIFMVDNNVKANRDYLQTAFPNVSFLPWDLYSDQLEHAIRTSALPISKDGMAPPLVVLVGIHLCGDLARRALELHTRCQTHALLLSPCCAMRHMKPKKQRDFPERFGFYDVPPIARRLQQPVYDVWCWMLWAYATSTTATATCAGGTTEDVNDVLDVTSRRIRIDLQRDLDMKSNKNYWLTVVIATGGHDHDGNNEEEPSGS